MPLPTREPKVVTPTAEQVASPNTQVHPPVKLLLHGEPGWGKTSLAAGAPGAMFVTSPLEQGVKQLIAAKRIAPIPVVNTSGWANAVETIKATATKPPDGLRTLVLDAAGGFEAMLVEYVNTNFYGGEYEQKFQSYNKGRDSCTRSWFNDFLRPLQAVHDKGINIIVIAHSQPKTIQNPTGKDYDRWQVDLYRDIAEETERWATDIGFGTFAFPVSSDGKAAAATRVLKMQNHPAYAAKSQTGFGQSIDMGTDPAAMWNKLVATFKQGG